MNDEAKTSGGKAESAEARRQRLAQALRRNLRRRKATDTGSPAEADSQDPGADRDAD